MSVSYNVTTTPSSGATTSLPLSQKSVSELWVLVQSQGLSAASALLMHGVFILLFILALSYLFRTYPDGYRIPGRTFLRLTAILLAVFAVVQVVLDVSLVILIANVLTGKVTRGSAPRMLMWTYRMLYLARQGSLAVNNLIADILFLYRCKRIWGTHRLTPYIITFVSFLIIGTAAIAGVTIYYKLNIRIPFGAALGTNVVLLVLTAGRIWYKGRRAEPLMGRRLRTRWRAAVAIILESSLLYVAANMLYMISQTRNVPPFTGAQSICWGALAQLVNIIPMMMIVRVALNRSDEEQNPSQTQLHPAVAINLPWSRPSSLEAGELKVGETAMKQRGPG